MRASMSLPDVYDVCIYRGDYATIHYLGNFLYFAAESKFVLLGSRFIVGQFQLVVHSHPLCFVLGLEGDGYT